LPLALFVGNLTTVANEIVGRDQELASIRSFIDDAGAGASALVLQRGRNREVGALARGSSWHTHPGPSLVIVTQGTVTAYEGDDPSCTPHVYSATGTNAFVDIGSGDVHMIRDESGAVAKTVVVQLIPKNATRRIDVVQAPGNCPF
jgi:hypothetical protein